MPALVLFGPIHSQRPVPLVPRGLNEVSYVGTATWYDLCDGTNGAGAAYGCPCDDDSYPVAYAPAPQSGYTTSNGYGCNGTWDSKQHYQRIYIFANCTLMGMTPSVRDCPCYNTPSDPTNCQAACWRQSNDCAPTWAYTIADLTRAAFMALGFPLSVGRIKVGVTT